MNLQLLGYRTDIIELLNAADIFAFPSFREGLSVALMEAMASGLPCVVSNIRGNTDLIENGKGGFLCDPTNASEFAKSFQELISNVSLCDQIKKNNMICADEFGIGKVLEKMDKIYKI